MTSIPYTFDPKQREYIAHVEGRRVSLGAVSPNAAPLVPGLPQGATLQFVSQQDFERRFPQEALNKLLGSRSNEETPSQSGMQRPTAGGIQIQPESSLLGKIAPPQLAIPNLKTAEGLRSLEIVGDGTVRVQLKLHPGKYALGEKVRSLGVGASPDTTAVLEVTIVDGRVVPEKTWLRISPRLDGPLWTEIAGANLEEVSDDTGDGYRIKVDVRRWFDRDVTRTVFGERNVPMQIEAMAQALHRTWADRLLTRGAATPAPRKPGAKLPLTAMADLSSLTYSAEITRLRQPGAEKAKPRGGFVRLPLGDHSGIDIDPAKSSLRIVGNAKGAKVSGDVVAKRLELGEAATRIDADDVRGHVEIDLAQDEEKRWRDAVWRFSDLHGTVRELRLPTSKGHLFQLGGGDSKISGSMTFARSGITGRAKRPTTQLDLHYDGQMPRVAFGVSPDGKPPVFEATDARLAGRLVVDSKGTRLDGHVQHAQLAIATGGASEPIALAAQDLRLHFDRTTQALQLDVQLGDSAAEVAKGLGVEIPAGAHLSLALDTVSGDNWRGRASVSFEATRDGVPASLANLPYATIEQLDGARARVSLQLGDVEKNGDVLTLSEPRLAVAATIEEVRGRLNLPLEMIPVREGDTLQLLGDARGLAASQLIALNPNLDGALGRAFVAGGLHRSLPSDARTTPTLSAIAAGDGVSVAELIDRFPQCLDIALTKHLAPSERNVRVPKLDPAETASGKLRKPDVHTRSEATTSPPPLSIQPAPMTGMHPTTSVVQALGLFPQMDLEVRIPMRSGAAIGSSWVSRLEVQPGIRGRNGVAREPVAVTRAFVRNGKVHSVVVDFEPFLDGNLANVKRITFSPDAATGRLRAQVSQAGWHVAPDVLVTKAVADQIAGLFGSKDGSLPSDMRELVAAIDGAVSRRKRETAKGPRASAKTAATSFAAFDVARTQVSVANAQIRGERRVGVSGTDTVAQLEQRWSIGPSHLLRANPRIDRLLGVELARIAPTTHGNLGPTDTLTTLAKRQGTTAIALLAKYPALRNLRLASSGRSGEVILPSILDLGHGNAIDVISAKNVRIGGQWPYLTVGFDGKVREFVYRQKDAAGKVTSSIVGGHGDVSIELSLRPDKTQVDKNTPPSSFRIRGSLEVEEVIFGRPKVGDALKLGPSRLREIDLSVTADKLQKNADGILLPAPGSERIRFQAKGDISLQSGWISLQTGRDAETRAVIGQNRFRGELFFQQDPEFTAKHQQDLDALHDALIDAGLDKQALAAIWPSPAAGPLRPGEAVFSPLQRANLLRDLKELLDGPHSRAVERATVDALKRKAQRMLFPWQIDVSGGIYAVDIAIDEVQSRTEPSAGGASRDGTLQSWKISSGRFRGTSQSRALTSDEAEKLRQAAATARDALKERTSHAGELRALLAPAMLAKVVGGDAVSLKQRVAFVEALWAETSAQCDHTPAVRAALELARTAATPAVATVRISSSDGIAIREARGVALSVNLADGKFETPDKSLLIDLGAATLDLKPSYLVLDGRGVPRLGHGVLTDGGSLSGAVDEVRFVANGKPFSFKGGQLSVQIRDADLRPGQLVPDVDLGKVTLRVKVQSKAELADLLHVRGVQSVKDMEGALDIALGSLVLRHDGSFVMRNLAADVEAQAGDVAFDAKALPVR